jgi:F-type H+-transporting ATPase subunit delta
LSDLTCDALLVVLRHGRIGAWSRIVEGFRQATQAERGQVEVELVTAAPLDEATTARVAASVGQWMGATALLRARVDESILGGLILRVGDRVIDASVRYDLERMKEILGRPRQRQQAG